MLLSSKQRCATNSAFNATVCDATGMSGIDEGIMCRIPAESIQPGDQHADTDGLLSQAWHSAIGQAFRC
jgi:hypothetical protein